MSQRTARIAEDISILMPAIARRLLLEFFQQVEITQTQLFTILALFESDACPLCELSRRMDVAAPTITGIVDRLQSAGLVKRVPDTKDRRVINVVLTSKGVKIARKFRSTVKAKWEELLNRIPARDREDYLRITKEIYKYLS